MAIQSQAAWTSGLTIANANFGIYPPAFDITLPGLA